MKGRCQNLRDKFVRVWWVDYRGLLYDSTIRPVGDCREAIIATGDGSIAYIYLDSDLQYVKRNLRKIHLVASYTWYNIRIIKELCNKKSRWMIRAFIDISFNDVDQHTEYSQQLQTLRLEINRISAFRCHARRTTALLDWLEFYGYAHQFTVYWIGNVIRIAVIFVVMFSINFAIVMSQYLLQLIDYLYFFGRFLCFKHVHIHITVLNFLYFIARVWKLSRTSSKIQAS